VSEGTASQRSLRWVPFGFAALAAVALALAPAIPRSSSWRETV